MVTLDEGETALDEAALDAFADRTIGVLNDGCTALMTSIGHQSGCSARWPPAARRRRHRSRRPAD